MTGNEYTPSDALAHFAIGAADHGVASIEDANGPLIPFVMTVDLDGQRTLKRFLGDDYPTDLQRAKDFIDRNQASLSMYAIAWDGYVTSDEGRFDAIFVEAGELGAVHGVVLCLKYRAVRRGLLRRARNEPLEGPFILGSEELRFRSVHD